MNKGSRCSLILGLVFCLVLGPLGHAASKKQTLSRQKVAKSQSAATATSTVQSDAQVLQSVIAQKLPELTEEMAATAAPLLLRYNATYAQGLLQTFRGLKTQTQWNQALANLKKQDLAWVLNRCFQAELASHPRSYTSTMGGANTLSTVIGDMGALHDANPHGVPLSWDWANNPRIGLGNTPSPWTQMTAWGQVYEALEGNKATNTRVELKSLEAFYLSRRDGKWHKLQGKIAGQGANPMVGASYVEDFTNNVSKPANLRTESGGGLSVKLEKGYNFHFYPTHRATINPKDVAGIFTTVKARLIVDEAVKADDRPLARYLLSVGADYWQQDAQWNNFKTNGDAGIGRFKYITPVWQSFSMSTLSGKVLQKSPPPLNDE